MVTGGGNPDGDGGMPMKSGGQPNLASLLSANTSRKSDPTLPPAESELPGASFDDRRGHSRRSYQGILRVTINGREFHCKAVDISAGGICCGPLPSWARRGDPVLVQLYKPAKKILGRVAWRRTISANKGNVLIGVCFTRPHDSLVDQHIL
jgi:PilZ domain